MSSRNTSLVWDWNSKDENDLSSKSKPKIHLHSYSDTWLNKFQNYSENKVLYSAKGNNSPRRYDNCKCLCTKPFIILIGIKGPIGKDGKMGSDFDTPLPSSSYLNDKFNKNKARIKLYI